MMLKSEQDILMFTEKLVNVQSVVNSSGEANISKYIYELIQEWPYFQKNTDFVCKKQTLNDSLERFNVYAFVKGTKSKHDHRTLILMGHTDTVGIDDYGHLKNKACFPNELIEALTEEPLPEHIKKHLHSDEWYFGRGTLDMKAGVASHLYLLKYYSEHPEKLSGNLLFIAASDEEDSSHGMISAVTHLNEFKQTYNFSYIGAINADFVTEHYTGDDNRYIYKGTIGKLLPSFYIKGVESHVGSPFSGIDPNYLAAHLTKQISYNPELCDTALGETTVPPVSLKQTDLKPSYTVQTALAAFTYFNFFTFSWTPWEVLRRLKEQAKIAVNQAMAELNERYKQFQMKMNESNQTINFPPKVYLYEELYNQLVEQHGNKFSNHMEQFKENLLADESLDVRHYAMRVVEEASEWLEGNEPLIVLFYSSLYSPHMMLTGNDKREQQLLNALNQAIENIQPLYEHPIQQKNFFPHICDMSFLSLNMDLEAIDAIEQNNPAWGVKHYVNYTAVQELNIPSVNIGPYGFDAHSKHERMEKTYATKIVPNITKQMIDQLLS